MNIGVYVGSFDPVHLGHIKAIDYLLFSKIIDKIIMIPTGNYWDKINLIDINDRINMLKIFENSKISVDSSLSGYQYTYEILNCLKNRYSNATLYLIIGADILEKFHLWKNIELILQSKIIVINRNSIDTDKYISKFNSKDTFIVANDFEEVNISSTEIRQKIKENEDVSKILDERVVKYIHERNLYGC